MASARSSLTSTLVKLYVFSVLLSSWLVLAQSNIPNLPSCAEPCADSAIKASGCSASDAACLCKSNGFQSSTSQCASKVCPVEDQSSTIGALQDFCAAAQPAPPSTSTSSGSSSSQTGTNSPTGKPTNTVTQPSPTTKNSPTGTAPPATVTVTNPGTLPSTTPLPSLSLPSLSVPSGDGTSVVLETVTGLPTDNAALGLRAVMDAPLVGMLGVGILGAVFGSLAVL